MNKILTSPIFYILLSAGIFLLVRKLMKRNKRDIKLDFSVGQGFTNLLSTIENRYANRQTGKAGIYLDVPVTLKANNNTARPINLNSLMGNLSYDGETILQTKSDSTVLNNIQANPKSTSQPVTDAFQFLINMSTIKFLKEFVAGNKPRIKYDFKAKIQGKEYQFKDSTIINQTAT